MMKSLFRSARTTLLAVILILAPFLLSAPLAQDTEVEIKELRNFSRNYIGQTVVIRGILKELTGNPVDDGEFVIEDKDGNHFPVDAWAPLEIPPPMPGTEEYWTKNRPTLMSDYLGKNLQLRGKVRANIPRSRSLNSEYYLHIISAEKVQRRPQ